MAFDTGLGSYLIPDQVIESPFEALQWCHLFSWRENKKYEKGKQLVLRAQTFNSDFDIAQIRTMFHWIYFTDDVSFKHLLGKRFIRLEKVLTTGCGYYWLVVTRVAITENV